MCRNKHSSLNINRALLDAQHTIINKNDLDPEIVENETKINEIENQFGVAKNGSNELSLDKINECIAPLEYSIITQVPDNIAMNSSVEYTEAVTSLRSNEFLLKNSTPNFEEVILNQHKSSDYYNASNVLPSYNETFNTYNIYEGTTIENSTLEATSSSFNTTIDEYDENPDKFMENYLNFMNM